MTREIVVLVSFITAAGCDGDIRMRGRVVHASGNPVPLARTRVDAGPNKRQFEDVARPEGCFTIGHVVAPGRYKYTVHITAPGFKLARGVISTIEDNAIVVLQRVNDAGRSSFDISAEKWPKPELAARCDSAR